MIRRISAIIGILVAWALPLEASSDYHTLLESEAAAAMREDVGYLASAMLEGRKAGSEGESLAAEYMAERLEECGVDVLSGPDGELFGLKQESGDTLRSHNVVGFIPGYDPDLRDHYIVIGARLDNLGTYQVSVDGEPVTRICYGAAGNASGLAMMLQLARNLQQNSVLLRRSVLFVAFGASLESQAGSWYFLNRSFADAKNIDAMVNLDMVGTPSGGFYAYTASNHDLNQLAENLQQTLQPVYPQIVSLEPAASDHRSFYAVEIPAVFFTTGMYPEYNTYRDTPSVPEYEGMELVSEYIYNYTLQLCNGKAPRFRIIPEENTAGPVTVSWQDCDAKPSFLGSTDPRTFLQKWVYVYLRYPQSAVEEGVQGRVQVDFVIDERGKVCDVQVARGVDGRLDDEAIRVISASPDWKPGRVRGQKVRTAISLYVEFKLEKK